MDVPILLWAVGGGFVISVVVLIVAGYRGLRTREAQRRHETPSWQTLQRQLDANPARPRQTIAGRRADLVARDAPTSQAAPNVNGGSALSYAMSRGHARIEGTPSRAGATTSERVGRGSGLTFAAATLLAVGLTSTVAQFVAAASLGIAEYFEWERSSGGLIALVGSIYMWAKCPNWEFWKKWIWLWVGLTVILAFITVNLMSHTLTN